MNSQTEQLAGNTYQCPSCGKTGIGEVFNAKDDPGGFFIRSRGVILNCTCGREWKVERAEDAKGEQARVIW